MLAALAFTAAFAPSAEDLFNASAFDVAGLVRDADVTGDGKLNFNIESNMWEDDPGRKPARHHEGGSNPAAQYVPF